MNYTNQPIKVMAIFSDGKVVPTKFRLDDQVVRIQKILKVQEEKMLIDKYIIYTCLQNGHTYKIKYNISTSTWYLSTN